MTHATVLSNLLGKIRYQSVVYNAKEQDYFTRGGMGDTTLVQHKMEVSDSKPTSKTSSNKVTIVSVGEVEFCTAFVVRVLGNNICGLMKGVDGSCNKYKTHAG